VQEALRSRQRVNDISHRRRSPAAGRRVDGRSWFAALTPSRIWRQTTAPKTTIDSRRRIRESQSNPTITAVLATQKVQLPISAREVVAGPVNAWGRCGLSERRYTSYHHRGVVRWHLSAERERVVMRLVVGLLACLHWL
jgi:hypothetical protein